MSQARDREADEDIEVGTLDPRHRATLLESQAEELRERLDTLLDEIARHHRRGAADLVRRYGIPVALTVLAAGAAVVAFTTWRRYRSETWIRLGGRAQAKLNRLLA
jgi:hypothetical protein